MSRRFFLLIIIVLVAIGCSVGAMGVQAEAELPPRKWPVRVDRCYIFFKFWPLSPEAYIACY